MFYAPSTGGFYIAKIHGTSIPADAVEISSATHAELLAGQASGKVIRMDGGVPVLADPVQAPPTPLQEIAALEAEKPITHRNLRELALAVADIASAITGKPVDENPAVREIQALEAQIAALRAQAKAQGLI